MPKPVAWFAENQPVTSIVDAIQKKLGIKDKMTSLEDQIIPDIIA